MVGERTPAERQLRQAKASGPPQVLRQQISFAAYPAQIAFGTANRTSRILPATVLILLAAGAGTRLIAAYLRDLALDRHGRLFNRFADDILTALGTRLSFLARP